VRRNSSGKSRFRVKEQWYEAIFSVGNPQAHWGKIGRATQLGVPCFLASPAWESYFESYEAPSTVGALGRKLTRQMVQWSNLTIEVRNFRNGQLSIAASSDLRQQLAKTKLTLDLIGIAIEERFASKLHVSRVKSVQRNPIIDEVLDYDIISLQY
jgi:hypothetical protein